MIFFSGQSIFSAAMDTVDPSRVDGSAHWEDPSEKQSFDEVFYLKLDGLMHRHRVCVVFFEACLMFVIIDR